MKLYQVSKEDQYQKTNLKSVPKYMNFLKEKLVIFEVYKLTLKEKVSKMTSKNKRKTKNISCLLTRWNLINNNKFKEVLQEKLL